MALLLTTSQVFYFCICLVALHFLQEISISSSYQLLLSKQEQNKNKLIVIINDKYNLNKDDIKDTKI